MSFLACRVYKTETGVKHKLEQMSVDDLSAGEVSIRVHYSTINYKDALAATGRGKILKKFPLNCGIDLAGTVESSTDKRFSVGDQVIANGCGLGEIHDGGLAEYARVPADWLIPLPGGLSLRAAMIYGTAGFTAALAIYRMQENHQTPQKGPILVTGASGGVGTMAIQILSLLGYQTIAVSGRKELHEFLTELGANKVVTPQALNLGDRPLEKAALGGVIDTVGGELLGKLIAHTRLGGNIVSVGLASSHKLNTTVFPFILRGVNLLGVSSTNCDMALRKKIWQLLAREWRSPHLYKLMTEEVSLMNISSFFDDLLNRKRYGRVLVNCTLSAQNI